MALVVYGVGQVNPYFRDPLELLVGPDTYHLLLTLISEEELSGVVEHVQALRDPGFGAVIDKLVRKRALRGLEVF